MHHRTIYMCVTKLKQTAGLPHIVRSSQRRTVGERSAVQKRKRAPSTVPRTNVPRSRGRRRATPRTRKKARDKNGTGTRTVPQAATRAYPRRSRPSSPTNSNSTQVAGAPGPPSVTARASAGRSWGARRGGRPRGGARRLGIPAASAWRGAARRGGTGGRAIGADGWERPPCPRAQLARVLAASGRQSWMRPQGRKRRAFAYGSSSSRKMLNGALASFLVYLHLKTHRSRPLTHHKTLPWRW
jgi:hypothetical protein